MFAFGSHLSFPGAPGYEITTPQKLRNKRRKACQSSTPRAEETIQEDKGQAPIPGRIVPAPRDDGGGESFRTYYE
jgi:hypothetical protein